MAIHSAVGASRRSSPQTMEVTTLPSPVRGMDGRRNIAEHDPTVCIYTYNILTNEYGMKVRNGYKEYAINVNTGGGGLAGVLTLIPYEGVDSTAADRLFAVTNEGIWDVSVENDESPPLEIAFADNSGNAGKGVFTHYIDGSGETLLYYADGQNGLFVYTPDTDLWEEASGISGVDTSKVRFIVVHKQRMWMIEEGSTIGWYLGIGSNSGQAQDFNFGAQFKHGGELVGLYNWTVDGGIGLDDHLVAISSSGDIIPYKGSDPDASTGDIWSIIGVYFVGAVAGGIRCASEFGGDLLILSTYGLTSMSDLLTGVDSDATRASVLGGNLGRLLRTDVDNYRQDEGWGINLMPSEGLLLISTPQRANGIYIQYAYDIATNSFGMWRGVPILSHTAWRSTVYIGTKDTRILSMASGLDNVQITPPVDDQNGQDIIFSTLLSYSALGSSGIYKRAQMARPDFMASDVVAYKVRFKFDYDVTEILSESVRDPTNVGVWDTSEWDLCVWEDSELSNAHNISGSFGYGRTISLAIQGAAKSETWLLSVDIMWNAGGAM